MEFENPRDIIGALFGESIPSPLIARFMIDLYLRQAISAQTLNDPQILAGVIRFELSQEKIQVYEVDELSLIDKITTLVQELLNLGASPQRILEMIVLHSTDVLRRTNNTTDMKELLGLYDSEDIKGTLS